MLTETGINAGKTGDEVRRYYIKDVLLSGTFLADTVILRNLRLRQMHLAGYISTHSHPMPGILLKAKPRSLKRYKPVIDGSLFVGRSKNQVIRRLSG